MNSYKIIDTGIRNPDISIAMLAYNHGKYIAQALDSILMQETTYSYKIIIAEDGSKDDTRTIILDYQAKYPDRFKVILQNENVGAQKNNIDLLSNLEGNYVAALEGDDYWTDPFKLQQQVDFLEENSDYVLTHHDASVIDENGNHLKDSKLPANIKKDFNKKELQRDLSLATLTLCFRNIFLNKVPDLPHVVNGDMALISILGLYGKGKYMEKIQKACYRVHSGGIWSQTSRIKQNMAKYGTYEEMSKYFFRLGDKNLGVFYRKKLRQQFRVIFVYYIKNKNIMEAFKYYWKFNLFYIKSKLGD